MATADTIVNDWDPDGLDTDEMILQMGPQHPATHGVLRVELRTDGEIVKAARPHIGYLHRCFEKHCENVDYPGVMPYADRMDYCAAMGNTLGFALAVEKLQRHPGEPVRRHRARDHGGAAADRLARGGGRHLHHGHRGLHPVPVPAAGPREDPRPLRVDLRGAAPLQLQLGGRGQPRPARRFRPRGARPAARVRLGHLPGAARPHHPQPHLREAARARRASARPSSRSPTTSPARTSAAAASRATCARTTPYCGYESYDFDVCVGEGQYGPMGSCFDRNWVRVVEMRESSKILHQALDRLEKMEKTDVHEKVPKRVKPPKGEVYFRSPRPPAASSATTSSPTGT